MSEQKLKIMVVDDIEDNRELLLDIFEEIYDVTCYGSGQECLDATPVDKPDLILLDINMPEMDGYEVCQRLKAEPETALIPIVFVSALIQAEERLKGFEVGAEDYVTKPYIDDDIIDVVTRVLEHAVQLRAFEKKNLDAVNTAFQAMSSGAELGTIIRYLQDSYTYGSEKSLADGLSDALASFGLKCCINIRTTYKNEYFFCAAGSIESKVFDRFHTGDRVLDFGCRTLVNSPNVSLLIKNMPVDNPATYGRLKDHLVVLVNGSEARVKVLESEGRLLEERQTGIQSVLLRSHEELKDIHALIDEQQDVVDKVVSTLKDKVEQLIFNLGLAEYQEQAIMDSLDEGIQGIQSLSELSGRVESSFSSFIEALDKLVE